MNNANLVVLTIGFANMEACLDRCAASPGDSIENKVQILFFEPDKSLPADKSIAWLARSVLDTKAVIHMLEADPDSANQVVGEFLKSWGGEDCINFPAWKGKSKTEQLQRVMDLFCAGLEGFCEGFLEESKITLNPCLA